MSLSKATIAATAVAPVSYGPLGGGILFVADQPREIAAGIADLCPHRLDLGSDGLSARIASFDLAPQGFDVGFPRDIS